MRLTDGNKLTESLIEAHKIYEPDGMPVIFDLQIEAEILGCELLWAEKAPPTVSAHPLANTKEFEYKLPQPTEGRIPLILNVIKRIKKEVGEHTALYGLACGPFTLASHLRSTNIFMDMYDDPDFVKKLLSYCVDVFCKMSDYYLEAGYDIIGTVDAG